LDNPLFLKDSLSREISALQDLLLLSEQEKEAVIQNDVQSISSIVEQQQSLLNALKTIRTEREGRLSSLSGSRAPDEPLNLKDVIDALSGETGDELRRLFAQRESVAQQLRSITALNRKLIDTQLQYTSYCVNLITGQGSTPGTYSESGAIKEGGARSIFDQSV